MTKQYYFKVGLIAFFIALIIILMAIGLMNIGQLDSFPVRETIKWTALTQPAKTEIKIKEAFIDPELVADSLAFLDIDGALKSIPIDSLPLYKEYLEQSADKHLELERTSVEVLDLGREKETFALLKYGCGNKACQTQLIKIVDSQVQSLEVAFGIFQEVKLSPDQQKALFRYGHIIGEHKIAHVIVPIDLEALEKIYLTSNEFAVNELDHPVFTINDYEWSDETTVRFSLENPSTGSLSGATVELKK